MTAVTVELPDPLHARLSDVARARGVSVGELLAETAADRLDGSGREVLERRAARATPDAMREILDLVPHAEPDPWDRFPADAAGEARGDAGAA